MFLSYSSQYIKEEIIGFLKDQDHLAGFWTKKRNPFFNKLILITDEGRTPEQVAAELGGKVRAKDVQHVRDYLHRRRPLSLDDPISSSAPEDSLSIGDVLQTSEPDLADTLDLINRREAHANLLLILKAMVHGEAPLFADDSNPLAPQQRRAIQLQLRVFEDPKKPNRATPAAIAHEIGITSQGAGRLLQRAFANIKNFFLAEGFGPEIEDFLEVIPE